MGGSKGERERERGRECVCVRYCHPVLPESSSSSASITSGRDLDAWRLRGNKGIHTDEGATTKREDGIKKKHFIASHFSSHFCLEHLTSRAPVKTHTYDIYIKFLYIFS